MWILDEIEEHVENGRLLLLKQTFPGFAAKRAVYVTPELLSLLEGPWETERWERRWYRVRQFLDDFIDGTRLTLRSAPRKKSSCDMSILDPEENEIWEMRCRDPKPGIRIFGSFAAINVFVALTCAPHECLGQEPDWNLAIAQYKSAWASFFTNSAITGHYPNGYLTNAIIFD